MREKILIKLFWYSIFITFLNYVGIKFYLYWTLKWYDIPVHILFGAWAAYFVLWLVYLSKYLKFYVSQNSETVFSIVIISVLIIGTLWEIYEFKLGLTNTSLVDRIDNVKDILDDLIGALFVGLYFVRNILPKCQE